MRTIFSIMLLGVIALVFSYEARVPEEFERVYGPNGEWAEFFRRGKGYIGTELLRDVEVPGRYLVIDRWESAESYNAFAFIVSGEAAFGERVAKENDMVVFGRDVRM